MKGRSPSLDHRIKPFEIVKDNLRKGLPDTFENFALHQRLLNYQHDFVGGNLAAFDHAGVQSDIAPFVADDFGLGLSNQVRRDNVTTGKVSRVLSKNFLEEFRSAHYLDYILYNSALAMQSGEAEGTLKG